MSSADNPIKQAMVHFKDKNFSEELCRLVAYSGGKTELVDAILREFSDDTSLTSKENMILQIQDSSWSDEKVYVDLRQQEIPPRCHIRIVLRSSSQQETTLSIISTSKPGPGTRSKPEGQSVALTTSPMTIPAASCSSKQLRLGGESSSGCLTLRKPSQKELEVVTLEDDRRLSDEQIMEMAIIYRKETNRPLTKYQKELNAASQQLCLQNPGLLRQRQSMIDEARAKVIAEGFQFVKGKSRSKKGLKDDEESVPKRPKLSQSLRDNRIKEIEEDLRDVNDRIGFKDKRISAALNMKEYKKCDDIKEEVTTLKHKRRELEAELKRLQKSSRQSQYYFNRKSKSQSSSTSDMDSSEDGKKEMSSSLKHMATPESSAPSSRSHTPPPYSPSANDWDIGITEEVVDLTSSSTGDAHPF